MSTILQLIKVSKTFNEKGEFEVLRSIDISAKKGEFICIIGPSGCGKTVLLYLIAGFLQPTSGEILLERKRVQNPNTDRIMVFQDYILFPWKTVYGNVLFGLENANYDKEQKDKLVKQYLELVGLSQFSDWYPHKLSGGMQQRVAIARALIVNPKILLMDEPFSAIDSQHRKYLRNNLLDIWGITKKTIIFVTHSISEAVYLADKIYVLSARPSEVIKKYDVNIPRPRKKANSDYLELMEEIELLISAEFAKSMNNQNNEKLTDDLLRINLK